MYTRLTRLFSSVSRAPSASSGDILRAFAAASPLHFESEKAFLASSLSEKLRSLFNEHYELSPNNQSPLRTLSMQATLSHLGLASFYRPFLKPSTYLIGIHGTSQQALPAILPNLPDIKKIASTHNPYHAREQNVLFFYGNNIKMSLHYSALNSIGTETIDGNSDPKYYPARVGVLGFADAAVIAEIQAKRIKLATTQAAQKQSHHTQLEESEIGKEIQLPKQWHAHTLQLPVFSIKGNLRLFPLNEGAIYHNGVLCHWEAGVGIRKNQR
jgi:hypothetical protein